MLKYGRTQNINECASGLLANIISPCSDYIDLEFNLFWKIKCPQSHVVEVMELFGDLFAYFISFWL